MRYARTVRVLLSVLTVIQCAGAFGSAEDASELHTALRGVMRHMNQMWQRLPYNEPRNPDVSSQICPLVSAAKLESMRKLHQFDLERSSLPGGDVYMGVPEDAQQWLLSGDGVGFSREVLAIYLAPQFCLAVYHHLN